ncbi:MAG: type II toxin-antitoxin system VapC family toxin [Spirochaetales bacterium]|nr:type II toxin-antitoxin system VapC family toxin [Spirochaetales bacterium]
MIVVLDASAAAGIALNAANAEILDKYLYEADIVIAPDTYPSEICNVFWKYAAFSNLDPAKAQKRINFCIDLVDDYIDTAPMWREVFAESVKYRHPVYALFYLVLARRQNAILLTNDEKMKRLAKDMKIALP